jgi:hypothetical protein
LQTALQENVILHYSKAKVQRNGTHNYYICIGNPTHRDPIIQARFPAPIADRRVDRRHQLAPRHQLLIERLCYDRQQEINEEPPLIEENEVNEVVVEEQVLIEEEEEQEQEQQEQEPYQQTPRYHARLLIAHRELEPWLADCRLLFWRRFEEEERAFYEEEQQRVELQHVVQQEQEEYDNVPAAEEVLIEENIINNKIRMEAVAQEAEEDYYDDVIPVVDIDPANDDQGYHEDLIVNIDDDIIINDGTAATATGTRPVSSRDGTATTTTHTRLHQLTCYGNYCCWVSS